MVPHREPPLQQGHEPDAEPNEFGPAGDRGNRDQQERSVSGGTRVYETVKFLGSQGRHLAALDLRQSDKGARQRGAQQRSLPDDRGD